VLRFSKKNNKQRVPEPDRIPRHVAIIMDGNGRWAKKRALPRSAGHAAGAETFRRIATYCKNIGVDYLTVYAFSTENWKRPPDEISSIMALLEKYLHEALEKMEQDKVKMKFFGNVSSLSPGLRKLIEQSEELSKRLDGMQVNVCINYGGRDELLHAVKNYMQDAADGKTDGNQLTEELFSEYMYSSGIPDPDLVIRPSGEMRLSNFLIWQTAYSELYFTDVLWPDFNERELDKAIISFQDRDRRYGGVRS